MGGEHGEYLPIFWEPGLPPYEAVRGHVSEPVAREAVRREIGWPKPSEQVVVTHLYARWIPRRNSQMDAEFWLCQQGPGAFKVTLLEEPPDAD